MKREDLISSRLLTNTPFNVPSRLRRKDQKASSREHESKHEPLIHPEHRQAERADDRMQHSLFEGLEALLFKQQLLLHTGQVPLQLVHLRHMEEKNSLTLWPREQGWFYILLIAHKETQRQQCFSMCSQTFTNRYEARSSFKALKKSHNYSFIFLKISF